MTAPDGSTGIHGKRVRKGRGYESLRREMLQDPRLSFKALGILTYLLSLPDTWKTNSERLGKLRPGKEGRDAIRVGLRELEDAGYLYRERRSIEGRWLWIWHYTDDPRGPETIDGLPGDGDDQQEQDVSAGPTMDGLTVDGKPVDIEVLDHRGSTEESRERSKSKDSASAASTRSVDGVPYPRETSDEDHGYPPDWDEQDAAEQRKDDRTARLLARLEFDPDVGWFDGCEETMARSMLEYGRPYKYVKNKILKDRREAPVF